MSIVIKIQMWQLLKKWLLMQLNRLKKLDFFSWGKLIVFALFNPLSYVLNFICRVKLTDITTDLEVFKYVDDSILKLIETSTDGNLTEAKNIIERIKTRNWYKHKVLIGNEDESNGFAIEYHVRKQYIQAANKKMPNTIIFHGEADDEIYQNVEDNDFHRTIVYTST